MNGDTVKQFFDFIGEVGEYDEREGVIRPNPSKVAQYKNRRLRDFEPVPEFKEN